MYVCTGAQKGQSLERAANMIIFFIAINNYFSHTDCYIIIKGNGAVYKDLNLARASRRTINCHVTVLIDHAGRLRLARVTRYR